MPDMADRDEVLARIEPGVRAFAAAEWDACAGTDNPFLSHAFLSALEDSGSVGGRTGWQPLPLRIDGVDGSPVAVLPAFPRLLPAARIANDVPAGTTTQPNASTSQARDSSDSAGTAAPRHAAQTDTTGGRPGEDPSATVAGTATEPMTK